MQLNYAYDREDIVYKTYESMYVMKTIFGMCLFVKAKWLSHITTENSAFHITKYYKICTYTNTYILTHTYT